MIRFPVPSLIMILFLSSCKDPVEERCLSLCDTMVQCSMGDSRTTDMKAATEIKVSCMDGCTRYQSDIMECYRPGMNCEETGRCITRALMNQ